MLEALRRSAGLDGDGQPVTSDDLFGDILSDVEGGEKQPVAAPETAPAAGPTTPPAQAAANGTQSKTPLLGDRWPTPKQPSRRKCSVPPKRLREKMLVGDPGGSRCGTDRSSQAPRTRLPRLESRRRSPEPRPRSWSREQRRRSRPGKAAPRRCPPPPPARVRTRATRGDTGDATAAEAPKPRHARRQRPTARRTEQEPPSIRRARGQGCPVRSVRDRRPHRHRRNGRGLQGANDGDGGVPEDRCDQANPVSI